ncbi:protein WEAK CHLOROPLAST MOVEMENT UNDER BLUE LIGHT 1-like [Nicotiana tomentosiformis]|uniref:protein WEAK CHLOROPLAST MOVEMENT UNDER BLUE LIGHT 1-like n=1 Tax=Nicotiana tomentosiformis TaxID=4098 RepID=UPI00388CE3FD
MAKTSKTVPQKEKASFSRPSGDKTLVEPSIHDYVPGPCTLKIDFKVENPSSVPEDTKPKTRRVRKKEIALSIDSVQRLREEEEEEEEEEDNASALVIRSAKAIEVARAPEPMVVVPVGVSPEVPSLDRSTPNDFLGAMTMGHSPSLPMFSEEALKEARELKTPDMGGGSSVGDPFRDCFTGVYDASDIGDTSLLLEKAQRFITRAINSQKDEAIKDLQADLAKVREEGAKLDKQVSLILLKYGSDSTVEVNPSLSQLQQKVEKIGLLREEVDLIKAECNRWKETLDRLAAKKETILTKLLSADVQLRSVKQKGSAQAKKIEELEIRLAEAKAEVKSSKVLADKSIAVYQVDTEAAQMEAREAVDTADARAHWVAELAKCRSRKETLEEIHARGFDLTEEIKRVKELEVEAEALASDDDDDGGSKSGSEDGEELDSGANAPEGDQEAF